METIKLFFQLIPFWVIIFAAITLVVIVLRDLALHPIIKKWKPKE